MISSAVVIPEQQSPPRSPPSTLKRRQSSITSESSKRPRLDTQNGTDSSSRNGLPSPQSAMSPPRRKSAFARGAAEEKKRGQRLFGALLGTLSQSSSTKPVHRKRDEIEQKQRERVKKENEDREKELRRRRTRLDQLRRVEQVEWDAESARIRHRNMRVMAGFLRTKSEPVLYYKPWEMRPEEKEAVERQIREVEDRIRAEIDAGQQATRSKSENGHDLTDEVVSSIRPSADLPVPKDDPGDDTDVKDTATPVSSDEQLDQSTKKESEDQLPTVATPLARDETDPNAQGEKPAKSNDEDHDHGSEELVEGQEDDVIY